MVLKGRNLAITLQAAKEDGTFAELGEDIRLHLRFKDGLPRVVVESTLKADPSPRKFALQFDRLENVTVTRQAVLQFNAHFGTHYTFSEPTPEEKEQQAAELNKKTSETAVVTATFHVQRADPTIPDEEGVTQLYVWFLTFVRPKDLKLVVGNLVEIEGSGLFDEKADFSAHSEASKG
ncbi:MAG: hypothetical protein M1819_004878 [Sarea resinae]|nr:MAG: hypothetical protein M1819_004878 [Sarea resinae]